MAQTHGGSEPFTGFGVLTLSQEPEEGGVFILVVFRDGSLTAAAYATERGAMAAALESLDDERDEDDAGGPLEELYRRAQERIADEGGALEIFPSPIYGG